MAKYPTNIFIDFIDRAAVEFYGKTYRVQYSLTIDHMDSDSEKFATVLLMHPTNAEQFQSDPMTNQIIRFLSKQDYQNICFVYLFPYRATTPAEMRELILADELSDIIEVNSEVIRQHAEFSTDFILAWGDRPHYVSDRKFEAATLFVDQLIAEPHITPKVSVFKYSHAPSLTENGQPATTTNKVIESLISFEKKSKQEK